VTEPREHVFAQLAIREVPAKSGGFAMEMPIGPHVFNNRGGLQGGLLATLIDVVAGCAIVQGLPPGVSAATSDLSLHFLSAVTVGPAYAEANVVRQGRRSAVVQIEVYDEGRDVLAAIGTASFALVELRPDQLDVRTTGR
jgi:uncharacterized protein (TIGR00369 family)